MYGVIQCSKGNATSQFSLNLIFAYFTEVHLSSLDVIDHCNQLFLRVLAAELVINTMFSQQCMWFLFVIASICVHRGRLQRSKLSRSSSRLGRCSQRSCHPKLVSCAPIARFPPSMEVPKILHFLFFQG